MNSDTIDSASAGQALHDLLGDGPVARNAAAVLSVDSAPWLTTTHEAADYFAQNGSHVVAKRVRRTIVPAEHLLLIVVETSVRLRVIDLRDELELSASEERGEPEPSPIYALLGRRPT